MHRLLSGAVIQDAFTQEKNELIIVLVKDSETQFLQFSASTTSPALFVRKEYHRAKKNSVSLLPGIIGDVVCDVTIAVTDRIIRIGLKSGRALMFVLFSGKTNMFLLDPASSPDEESERSGGFAIADRFRKKIHPPVSGATTSGIIKGSKGREEQELFPSMSFSNALPDISNLLSENPGESTTVDAWLRRSLPFVHADLAAELFFRSGIPPSAAPALLHPEEKAALLASLKDLLEESGSGSFSIYLDGADATHFSLVHYKHLFSLERRDFGDIHEALFFFLRKKYSSTGFAEKRKPIQRSLQRTLDRLVRSRQHLAGTEELRARAEEYEKFGNLLMIQPHLMRSQPGRITVPDLFVDPRIVVTIPLREDMTLLRNAERYFDKAGATRASVDEVISRAAWLDNVIQSLQALKEELSDIEDPVGLRTFISQHKEAMRAMGLSEKGEKEDPFPFRRYRVVGGFEVWVGKSSANNDLLTTRHARPNDLWFHSRGVGGSHVVLKTGSGEGKPTKEAIVAAASIAAFYSKYKNAKKVPVAYTEKKYVHKPKGAPAGTVTLEREKVVMVEPRLPEEKIDPQSLDYLAGY
jgi:predicted ribosome quality control (RQC) complex YloA/Tae2 family protein